MKVTKVVTRHTERIGFWSRLEYVDEIKFDPESDDFLRVFLFEFLRVYAKKTGTCRTPKQLVRLRETVSVKRRSHTSPLGSCFAIDNYTVEFQ